VAAFEFQYDNKTNTLSATIIITDAGIPGFERKDAFSKQLLRDKLPYFPIQQVYIHNGSGCNLEASLINKG
jgi:hypothetical protein